MWNNLSRQESKTGDTKIAECGIGDFQIGAAGAQRAEKS